MQNKGITIKELTVNMGPQHPATHGVLRLVLELEGEIIKKCIPHIGYLHRGIEKLSEDLTYVQSLPLTDRVDYLSSMVNNEGFCVAIEKLMGIEVPERAKFIRTMMAEMARICSHLVWIATHALDIGAMTVFLYAMRDREELLEMFEMVTGARLTVSYPRVGGVRCDVNNRFLDKLYNFIEKFPKKVEEYETLIDRNRVWLKRTKGVGVITAQEAINWGLTGPTLRGSGVYYDVRKFFPYDAYDKVDFEVPVGKNGDVYDRYRCRMLEFRQSARIIKQCIEKLPEGPILADNALRIRMPESPLKIDKKDIIFEIYIEDKQIQEFIQKFTEVYASVEAPRGELGFYIICDDSSKPYRMRVRAPSFVHAGVLPKLCEGSLVADVIANIGSIDIVLGECDR
ncbi:MAG: NADH dehydrogenase (quinone) subunit D [Thermodesulfovibrio sp.]|jgi:NADH dehydrogenase I D subunit|uniref:NADH dehydrogenase (quinone) subunit D n=1 Tax=unclassified Thermodesulfovibrio TaxID=2645936 RepID=UPI00083ADAB4|nr:MULTISPECIES: NADH dehydrogenase (quinone) subunit D [unclassified Thermodesulfovibrio]MDI1471418.1 NADH dehydrogenase (quinone) subunit D [Thermodesulfovibrio sp. 1176]MDI6714555.1 NADH dehydrogenase (quinone) subunit D [Thermodesulfovibrio sp.]ODA43740.1 NADH-ubiquinone oxidoreductase chain D [Thermodesulfovibrio sp. N1]